MQHKHTLQARCLAFLFLALSATLSLASHAQTNPPLAVVSGVTQNLQGAAPFPAVFSIEGSSCSQAPCVVHWDYGDGESVTSGNFGVGQGHIYDEPGTYTVTFTITNGAGQSDSDSITVRVAEGEPLDDYVAACQIQVGFSELPDINCYDGRLFADNGGVIRDFVGYERINETVDLAFACRWLQGDKDNPQTARSAEMWVHNRDNGATCFFAARDQENLGGRVPPELPSPTSFQANETWKQPAELEQVITDAENSGLPPTRQRLRCVGCHAAGPVIASSRIAEDLARFGLLNNGHDTFNTRYHAVTTPGGSAFDFWNEIIEESRVQDTDTCASSCHNIAYNSITPTINPQQSPPLLPNILSVIADHLSLGTMPPSGEDSPFRWINHGALDWRGDQESFAEAKENYSRLLSACDAPTRMEVRAVGSPVTFEVPTVLPGNLEYFNLKEGLKCNNADQSGSVCPDYRTSYLCDGEWVGPFNMDSPSNSGDDESRWKIPGLCESPTAIEAVAAYPGGDFFYYAYGPDDRLAELSPYGLTCNNTDQVDGQCANYVVRYRDCIDAPEAHTTRLTSAWSGRLLTLSGNQNDAATRAQPANSSWNSQDWEVVPIEHSDRVRLRNLWTNRYLNIQHDGENAVVTAHDLVPEWDSMQWVLEPASGGVRLRNVWSGRYLTVVDTSDYSEVLAKTLNTGWSSQVWQL